MVDQLEHCLSCVSLCYKHIQTPGLMPFIFITDNRLVPCLTFEPQSPLRCFEVISKQFTWRCHVPVTSSDVMRYAADY